MTTGDPLKKVQRGNRLEIPAEAYNAFIDAARQQRASQHDVLREAGAEFRQAGIIKVRNTSSDDLARFAVLALTEPIVTPSDKLQQFKNQVNLEGGNYRRHLRQECNPDGHRQSQQSIRHYSRGSQVTREISTSPLRFELRCSSIAFRGLQSRPRCVHRLCHQRHRQPQSRFGHHLR